MISKSVPAGGLSARSIKGGQAVVSPDQHFGGGASRVGRPPVRPRGIWPLAGFGLLGLTSLILVVASLTRIMPVRRFHPADPAQADGPAHPSGSDSVPPPSLTELG